MARPLLSRALLTIMLAAPALGCVAKPPEKPIVLRPHHPERRLANRPRVAPPAAEPESAASLSQDDKERLFRDFDAYLARSGRSP